MAKIFFTLPMHGEVEFRTPEGPQKYGHQYVGASITSLYVDNECRMGSLTGDTVCVFGKWHFTLHTASEA